MLPEAVSGLKVAVAGSFAGYGWLALTVGLTVYGQLVFKWRLDVAGAVPSSLRDRLDYVTGLVFEPWMVSVALSVVFASVAWWATLREFELSYAYPFMALSFVLVLLLSGVFFSESITSARVIGVLLVVAGLIVSSQS
jgi:multidrug transporter EmrE-like cation transporter